MLLKQTTGTLADADLQDLNKHADPNDTVEQLNSLRSRMVPN
jgi:hypothetical protein